MNTALRQVHIENFRSIRTIDVDCRPIQTLVGANGAGKSNIVDAIELLSDIHRVGLDDAISSIGGIDSILRRSAGTKASILKLAVTVDIPAGDSIIHIRHGFAIEAMKRQNGRFRIQSEDLAVTTLPTFLYRDTGDEEVELAEIQVHRSSAGFISSYPTLDDTTTTDELKTLGSLIARLGQVQVNETRLFIGALAPLSDVLSSFVDAVSAIQICEIDPEDAREDSEKSSNPRLTRYGSELPTVLEWLGENHPTAMGRITAGLREVIPDLNEIKIIEAYGEVRALEFLMESGPNPLRPSEVSDGTIRYLGLLTALHDPRLSFMMFEEPENSLHPYMIARLCEQFVEASREKQLLITTHSPFLMTKVPLETIYVVYNTGKGTQLSALSGLHPALYELWSSGEISVIDSLEARAIREMNPTISS